MRKKIWVFFNLLLGLWFWRR